MMGTWNEVLPFNGINPTTAENMPWYDAWGSNQTYPHYAIAWATTMERSRLVASLLVLLVAAARSL